MKRKPLTEEDIYNAWLVPYHGITAKELAEKEPDLIKTPDWFVKYAVTQEQHDEWHEWLIKSLMKELHCSRAYVKRHSWAIYLNCAPNVKTD